VEVAADLDAAELERLLPGRAVRTYPALLSTEADALAWARAGAPAGALVVADYQASPRGRGGLPWTVQQGVGLGCSLVLRPSLAAAREGWLYTVATVALADVVQAMPGDATIEWPDEVVVDGETAAAAGVTSDVGVAGVTWAALNLRVDGVSPPRGPVLARLVAAVESRLGEASDAVLDEQRHRCATLGRAVRARLVPMGPSGVVVEGVAVDVLPDGALLVQTEGGARVAVLPHHLGVLEELDGGAEEAAPSGWC
jgi:BirA family biotin operon repressor/biotin-[acetyl-CoA-carboxylase] ligase